MSNRDSFILKLMRDKGMSLTEAEAFVEDLDIPEAPEPAEQPYGGAWRAGDAAQVRGGSDKVAPRFITAQRGPDGLTASQAEGMARGVRLCPNCQQPVDRHLFGCIRDPNNGYRGDEVARVVTKTPLAPSS